MAPRTAQTIASEMQDDNQHDQDDQDGSKCLDPARRFRGRFVVGSCMRLQHLCASHNMVSLPSEATAFRDRIYFIHSPMFAHYHGCETVDHAD